MRSLWRDPGASSATKSGSRTHCTTLRHFFASGLIAAGCDVVTVQRKLKDAGRFVFIEPQSPLVLVGSVASKAPLRQNRMNLSSEIDSGRLGRGVGAWSPQYKKSLAAFEAKKKELQEAIAAYAKDNPKAKVKTDKTLKELSKALTDHDKKAPTKSVVPTLALAKERKTHVLIRGDFLQRGEKVFIATKPP
jgi:hypothetical protein